MSAETVATPTHVQAQSTGFRRPIPGVTLYACAFLVVLVLVNQVLAAVPAPDYATWTGIRPLEGKLRLLTQFAREGPVDAVIFGNSMADMGFSTEQHSQLMSAALGRPYRAFNFSTGAATFETYPKMYRLMRTAVKPRALVIVETASIKREDQPSEPDEILAKAPVHRSLGHQWLLDLDKQLWDLPLFRFASAWRDRLLHGSYVGLPGQGTDLYRVSPWGDRIGYGFEAPVKDIDIYREAFQTQLMPPGADATEYFTPLQLKGLRELRQLAAEDGIEIVYVGFSHAATLYKQPAEKPEYLAARLAYMRAVEQLLGSRLVYAIDDFWVPQYAVEDTTHLNRYGAEMFTAWATYAMLGRDPAPGWQDAIQVRRSYPTPDLTRIRSDDPSLGPFAGIVVRDTPEQGRTLTLEIVQNHATPKMSPGEMFIGLRLPDNSDLVVPAERLPDNRLRATFADLPAVPGQVYLARPLEMAGGRYAAPNLPLSSYTWSLP